MKHNWVKEIFPKIVWFQEGPGVRNTQYRDSGVKLLNVANLVDSHIDLSTSNRYISEEEAYGKYKHFLVDNGDFIIASSGIQASYFHKKMGFINKTHLPLCMNTSTIRFKVLDASKISIFFFQYYLKSFDFNLQLQKALTGCAQLNFGPSHLKKMKCPVPPIEMQNQIVAELDKINEVIEDCRELLRNLDALAKSLFYDYFGDPITNPKGWQVRPLKNAVIEMFIGPFGSALKTDCYVCKEKAFAMVYEQKHAIKKTLNQDNHYIDEEKYLSLKRFEVIPFDFIMSCRGTIGQLYQVPENSPRGIIHPSLMKIRLNTSTYNSIFFKHILPIFIKEQQTKGNCVQMAITAKELGAKKLPVPPLELQEKFAERIEQINAQKNAVEETIANLQTLLDSRMDYWFN